MGIEKRTAKTAKVLMLILAFTGLLCAQETRREIVNASKSPAARDARALRAVYDTDRCPPVYELIGK